MILWVISFIGLLVVIRLLSPDPLSEYLRRRLHHKHPPKHRVPAFLLHHRRGYRRWLREGRH
jgi:hypothetical protein